MKRIYQQPQLHVVLLEESDCIATSPDTCAFSEEPANKNRAVLGNERNHPIWDD